MAVAFVRSKGFEVGAAGPTRRGKAWCHSWRAAIAIGIACTTSSCSHLGHGVWVGHLAIASPPCQLPSPTMA